MKADVFFSNDNYFTASLMKWFKLIIVFRKNKKDYSKKIQSSTFSNDQNQLHLKFATKQDILFSITILNDIVYFDGKL